MYKAGTITDVAPSLGMAVAVNGANKWIVPQSGRGQFKEGKDNPELCNWAESASQPLPAESESIYFLQDESDPKAVKLWATKQEYESVLEAIKKQKELDRQKAELAARPKIRFWEQYFRNTAPVGQPVSLSPDGDPTVILPEMYLDDFLKKYPRIDRYDRFTTTTGDIYQQRKRWAEVLTPQGWVPMEKDPRQKP